MLTLFYFIWVGVHIGGRCSPVALCYLSCASAVKGHSKAPGEIQKPRPVTDIVSPEHHLGVWERLRLVSYVHEQAQTTLLMVEM